MSSTTTCRSGSRTDFDFRVEPFGEWMWKLIEPAMQEAGLNVDRDRLRQAMGEGHVLIVRDKLNNPVGGAHFRLRTSLYTRRMAVVVTGLYLAPEYRQGRIGIWLIEAVEEACLRTYKHCDSVGWVVRPGGPLDRLLPAIGYRTRMIDYEARFR